MAIQLGRAIGLQGGIPQSNIPQMIQKIGQDISTGIEKVAEKKEAKAAQEQKLKDAILANIDLGEAEGTAEDMNWWSENAPKITAEIVEYGLQRDKTPSQLQAFYNKKKSELADARFQMKKDYKAYEKGLEPEMRGTYHVDEYDRLIEGSPTREVEETTPVDPSNSAINKVERERIESQRRADLEGVENEDAINEINAKYDAEMPELLTPKTQKRTIEGQKPYFATDPLTRFKNQQDLNTVLQKSKIQKSVGALTAMKEYEPNFVPESLINVHTDKNGVVVATPNEEGIKNSRDKYILSMTYEGSYGKDHDIEKRALAYAAMQKVESENTPEDQKRAKFEEYLKVGAGRSFDRMMETTIENETRKTNEARAKSGSGSGSGSDSKEPRVKQIEGSVPPPLEQLRRNQIGDLDEKIQNAKDELNLLKNRARGATGEVKTEEVKKAAAKAKEQSESIAKWEQEKKNVENKKYDVNDYYIFSTKTEAIDNELNFYIEGKPSIAVKPTSIFREGGKTYIGGLVKEDGEMKDVLYPYDENNRGVLETNKPELVVKLDKLGFKTNEDEAASKKSGKTATAPKAAAKNVLDKIKAKTTKPIAEYQVNKKGTKAKVKFSDGTEQEIDL